VLEVKNKMIIKNNQNSSKINKLTTFKILFHSCIRRKSNDDTKSLYKYCTDLVTSASNIEFLLNEIIETKTLKNVLIEKKIIEKEMLKKENQLTLSSLLNDYEKRKLLK
jgi:hypothetical protein